MSECQCQHRWVFRETEEEACAECGESRTTTEQFELCKEVERLREILDNLYVQSTVINQGWISIPEVEWDANMKMWKEARR